MPYDIRLRYEFFDHPKTIALEAACGDAGIVSLLRLWSWARVNRPKGNLTGLTGPMVERIAGWRGAKGVLLQALKATLQGYPSGWLDVTPDGTFVLHGWEEHQQWSMSQEARSTAASIAGKASAKSRQEKKLYVPLNGALEKRSTKRSTPSPSPSPTPGECEEEPAASDASPPGDDLQDPDTDQTEPRRVVRRGQFVIQNGSASLAIENDPGWRPSSWPARSESLAAYQKRTGLSTREAQAGINAAHRLDSWSA